MRITLLFSLFLLSMEVAMAVLPALPYRKKIDTTMGVTQYKSLYRQFPEATAIYYDSIQMSDKSVFVDVIPMYSDSFHKANFYAMQSEIPFEWNRSVERLIEVYTVERRNIGRVVSGKMPYYEQIFEQILAENGVPTCLKYLGIVESGINPYAVSKSGATGIWQFMYGTGKYLDMKISYMRDDRKDVYTSTDRAAKYLKKLYDQFGDWLLAIGAYNCGPGNMSKAIRKAGGSKDFWVVKKYLPRETRNYVPAFIAVNYMMEYKNDLNIIAQEPMTYHYPFTNRAIDQVLVKRKISFSSLAKVLDIPMEQLSFLNPGIKKNVIPYSKEGYQLKLPCDKVPLYHERFDSIMKEETIYAASLGDEYVYDRDKIVYKVKNGDNLSAIAQKHNCTVGELMNWNKLRNSNIFINQKLIVYYGAQVKEFAARNITKPSSNTKVNGDFVYYTIERGDTLWSISKKFPGVAIDSIKRDNQIYNVHGLQPGMVLKIGLTGNG